MVQSFEHQVNLVERVDVSCLASWSLAWQLSVTDRISAVEIAEILGRGEDAREQTFHALQGTDRQRAILASNVLQPLRHVVGSHVTKPKISTASFEAAFPDV